MQVDVFKVQLMANEEELVLRHEDYLVYSASSILQSALTR